MGKVTFDYHITSSDIQGVKLVKPQHEDALIFLEDECHITVMENGTAPLFVEAVGDLLNDIEAAHMCASYS